MIVEYKNFLDVRFSKPDQQKQWQVLTPFVFVVDGVEYVVPEAFWTDFASVPRVVWNIISPYDLGYGPIPHDFGYFTGIKNQEFWDEAGQLREDVRDVLLKVAEDVSEDIKEYLGYEIDFEGLIFIGSLTGPNWDDTSDVDLHFLIDFKKYDEEFLEPFLDYYRKNFNENEFTILDHSLEIFFQDYH